MDVIEDLCDVHDHGDSVEKRRVKCKYCDKTMTTFSRLKAHLGGVGTDVKSCEKVPEGVKNVFRRALLAKGSAVKKPVKKSLIGLPQKRSLFNDSNGIKHSKFGLDQTAGSDSWNSVEMNSMVEDDIAETSSAGNEQNVCVNLEKCIGKFFFETGIDISFASSPSFQEMINAALLADQVNCKIPTTRELRGRIFQTEVVEMKEYMKSVRESWTTSGCSLLLDGWVDGSGRQLVSFIVDCPKGPMYLRSADVSKIVNNVDALQLLLDGVMNEVGSTNIVQIVASSSTGWMAAVREQFMERNSTAIWSTSASYCVRLMLDKLKSMPSVKRALDDAKIVTKFIYSHPEVLKILKCHTQGKDLLDSSWLDFAVPFFTVEKIHHYKDNLETMFQSYEWMSSPWARSSEGKKVAELVSDASFWSSAEKALNSTIPLLKVYSLIYEADKPFIGYIYETIDQAKETIKEEFEDKRSQYQPVWDAIDSIWNNHLHSFLHGAGYYLNPSIYYADDFYQDEEVAFGLLCCVVRMVRDKHTQDLISIQLDKYRTRKGDFEEGSGVDKRNSTSPVQWWATYGSQCPELQSFAIRVLSQTCDGASRYRLNRSLAEKLLSVDRNPVEQAKLAEFTSVHYNLHLRKYQMAR